MAGRIKVLIVDDSATMREYLATIIEDNPDFSIAGYAENGEEAIRVAQAIKPDIISMDIHMPVMNGLDAVREIMRTHPTPVVMVSGSIENKELNVAFNAIRAGALAVVRKPPAFNDPGFPAAREELLDKLRLMSEVAVIHQFPPREKTRPPVEEIAAAAASTDIEVLALAASTGGPGALVDVLSVLPADFPVPIVVVQHISDTFEMGLIDWMNRTLKLKVQLARHSQPLMPGQVFIAPSGFHMRITRNRAVQLIADRQGYLNMPAADVMFDSLVQAYGGNILAVIMTGMGDDGARGMQAVHRAGGITIAQDEASCVVFGMPKEAIALNAIDYIVPLPKISTVIQEVMYQSRRERA